MIKHTYMEKPLEMVDPDTIALAVSILRREWGEYGYRMGIHGVAAWTTKAAAFQIQHFDGSTFVLVVREDGSWEDYDTTLELQEATR